MSEYIMDNIGTKAIRYTEVDGYWYWQEAYDDDWIPQLDSMTHLPIVYGHKTLDGATAQAREIITNKINFKK